MATKYAEIADLRALGVPLDAASEQTADTLLTQASARLRLIAAKHGLDLNALVADEKQGEDYSLTLKNVVCQAVIRALNSLNDTSPAMSSGSQSALGYSVTTTYFNPGQSLYFLKSELRDLGILRQRFGALEVYDTSVSDD